LSTSLSHSGLQPAWKEEVNRRIEAHKTRKGISVVGECSIEEQQPAAQSRAAAAAARVAARYATVPSFSELQAAEARTALRAAEAATRAAMEAQAAAQAVLDHFETNAEIDHPQERLVETETPELPVHRTSVATRPTVTRSGGIEVRWEPDMPARSTQQVGRAEASRSWDMPTEPQEELDVDLVYELVEAAQEIPANLIEFPREIVAPRRMRPRITEADPNADEPEQLSIFEVDPNMVSTDPMAGVSAVHEEAGWIGSSWQEIKLDAQPQAQRLPDYYALQPDDAGKLYQAPFSRRMMATTVDAALIVGLVCGAAYLIASQFDHLPGVRVSEVSGVIALLGFAALYEWFFLTFAKVTPGMRYAQLSLCTFDEQTPSATQIKGRLKAMLISVLPVGLGMLWSIFDEDQMSWHDRLSKTYLRLS
jgi:uncharacterized RDD family membrane protein YckC